MNRSTLLNDLFTLSDICNDDTALVAELVYFHQSGNAKLSRIKSDLSNWRDQNRIVHYADTIDKILSLPNTYVKTFIQIVNDRTPLTAPTT
ncbi:MAG: hypothetical protein NTY39_12695 [Campylobacterales bacterium]|nr:hypothetical protein [Campylobacterales bacterium]